MDPAQHRGVHIFNHGPFYLYFFPYTEGHGPWSASGCILYHEPFICIPFPILKDMDPGQHRDVFSTMDLFSYFLPYILKDMDPGQHRGVFSTTDHQQASDTYFLGGASVKNMLTNLIVYLF